MTIRVNDEAGTCLLKQDDPLSHRTYGLPSTHPAERGILSFLVC